MKTTTITMTDGDREILADFRRARDKTIELIRGVPEKMLKKKAKGEEETLGELVQHIALVVDGWMVRCMKDDGPLPKPGKTTKAALIKALKASQARLLKHFRKNRGAAMGAKCQRTWGEKTYHFIGRNRVLYLTHHEVHHRGKIVLALRQWGFKKVPFMPF